MNTDRAAASVAWLAMAIGDLEAARAHGRVRPRIVAFHAQQAAEKALKAALVLSAVEPPRTHDLEDLRRRLPEDWRVRRSPRDLARLSVHGVESRYPDDLTLVSPIEAATAVRQAQAVVRRVLEDFERRGVSVAHLEAR
jgi:HEPN domain-containing protein